MGYALDEGLLYLQHLKFLEELTLEHILIRDVEILCTVLHGMHRLHYLHLNAYFGLLNINEVLIQLQNKALFSNLETIKLSGRAIDLRGIGALAEFKNLRILSIKTWRRDIDSKDCWQRLFSSCQRLETVFLPRFSSIDEPLTLWKNLSEVELRQISENPRTVAIPEQCHNLRIHVKESSIVDQLLENYPHLSICLYNDNNII
ncbi:PREDICTED: uncharacterized protein LOC105558622 [Vollenhovia emeryi]|uniref:uncharacterized protein LOC105558622 n=1 Tax=Vollenhovia emeryi TaxID=411798 RepID=UPI0005F4E171|nr:PREDICTED: uncharacterized protein LOC105558622 [Vollenhovia emeryi]